jgi:Phage integrase, N-terminal SAM-like domain
MNAIVPIPPRASLPAAAFAPDFTRAAELAREEKAPATRRAYRSDFRIFEAWCRSHGVSALPAAPETVAAFLAHDVETGTRPSTLGRRIAAIRYAHKLAGHSVPTDDERVRRRCAVFAAALALHLRRRPRPRLSASFRWHLPLATT